MLISVILPAFNAERTIAIAVQSILNQTHVDLELLVADDGSTDQTAKILGQFADARLRVFHDGVNKGRPTRLNEMVGAAKGDFIARMDADDIAYPTRLEKQFEFLSNNHLDLVGSSTMVVNDQLAPLGRRVVPVTHSEIVARPTNGFPLSHPTWLGRKAIFEQIKYRNFDCDDQEFLMRAYKQIRVGNVTEIQLAYREPSLKLKKLSHFRWENAKAVAANRSEFGTLKTIQALAIISAKSLVDVAATKSGLGYRLLGHRAAKATEAELLAWSEIRSNLQ